MRKMKCWLDDYLARRAHKRMLWKEFSKGHEHHLR